MISKAKTLSLKQKHIKRVTCFQRTGWLCAERRKCHTPHATSLPRCFVCLVSGDWFGKILAYITLSPLVILVSFGTLIIFRRDLHTVSGAALPEQLLFLQTWTNAYVLPRRFSNGSIMCDIQLLQITFLCGTLLSEAINFVLKHVIKEARPYKGEPSLFVYLGNPISTCGAESAC